MSTASSICEEIARHGRFTLVSHENPDGDSVSSQLAMAEILRVLGKEARVVSHGTPPEDLQFLPGYDKMTTEARQAPEPDCIVVLDSSSPERTPLPEMLQSGKPVINIDHHRDNSGFGTAVWVDPKASSCAEMVAVLREQIGVDLAPELAELLYVGIYADTGGFRFANTNARALRICATAMETGRLDIERIHRELHQVSNPTRIRLRGDILSRMEAHADGRIMLIEMDEKKLEQFGAHAGDTEGITDEVMVSKGAEVGLFLRYYATDTKCNLRSVGQVDVGAVANEFGGGGHKGAAGCMLGEAGEGARERILRRLQIALTQG